MNLDMIRSTAMQFGNVLKENSPTILTVLGVTGMVTTVILAVKATPKASQILEQEKERRYKDAMTEGTGEIRPITKIETVKMVWKEYIPTAVVGAASVACAIGANSINNKRTAVLATAYSIAEKTMSEYKAKVIETIGEKKEEKIHADIAQDRLRKNPVEDRLIIQGGRGTSLFYESWSGRYFMSDIELVRQAQNQLNFELNTEGTITLNDFFYELGLPNVKGGERFGWRSDHHLMELKFYPQIATNEKPCIVLDYNNDPIPLP